jgi:hypothetical protein
MKDYTIHIGWLYPELMSTYGDRGNILYFRRRCEERNIKTELLSIDNSFSTEQFKDLDFIFGGGSQDTEQELVMRDLKGKKAEGMKECIEKNTPALFVCGSPQLMGRFYEPGIGKRIEGLDIFDIESIHPGLSVPRCIGNTVGEIILENIQVENNDRCSLQSNQIIIGFENHGGRTTLGKNIKPFAKVIKGLGNNGSDGLEGMVYKNAVGCYYHGPFLPKNPAVADFFIQRIIEVKYKEHVELKELDDIYENKAREVLLKRFLRK